MHFIPINLEMMMMVVIHLQDGGVAELKNLNFVYYLIDCWEMIVKCMQHI